MGAGVDHHRQETVLERVAAEDVRDRGADHRPEPVVEQRPYGMFAGRPDAEIRAGHENRGARRVRLVEHEFRIRAPGREEAIAETSAGDPFQVFGGNDLIRVHVGAAQ